MSKKPKLPLPQGMPSKKELAAFLASYSETPPVAEVARAFHLRQEERRELRHLMREVTGDARPVRGKPRGHSQAKHLPLGRGELAHVTVIEATGLNEDGELLAIPAEWDDPKHVPPMIVVRSEGIAIGIGDRALAKMSREGSHYAATVIRALPKKAAALKILGIIGKINGGAIVTPVSRKDNRSYFVAGADMMDADDEELVEIVAIPSRRTMGDQPAKVVARIGFLEEANSASRIAIHRHEIPVDFSAESIAIAEAAEPPSPEGRTGLRLIPLITIDGEDARDFDDAVFAEADEDAKNPGGWHVIVAIADVAHYVRSGSALDRDAFERGNSVYFPDRVVPMLPEALSNGLCSLKPKEDRYCLAVHLWLDRNGNTLRHHFVRGIMNSFARKTYTEVQETANALGAIRAKKMPKAEHGATGLLRYARDDEERIIANLYSAYDALKIHIQDRGPLDLNLPEHKVRFDEQGRVSEIYKVQRLDSHRLIEAFMIAANVAAADAITKARMGAIFRVHDAPDLAKLTTLKEMLKGTPYHFNPGGAIEARMFNRLLRQAEEKNEAQTIHTSVLRSQMQAFYGPQNSGHFGLALASYCHFTSPIRRYSDLIVHRALIALHGWGDDAIEARDLKRLPEIGEHISQTERRAMKAEREAMERYVALYMADHVGADFGGHITGVTSVGLFVELSDNGAQGFVPRNYLGDDFFQYDERRQQLIGRRSKRAFRLGQPLRVVLDQVDTVTGSLRFALPESLRRDHAATRPNGAKPKRRR